VIRTILPELSGPGCVILHDAVYCAQSDIELVQHAFRDEIQARGIGLKLDVVA
jgi:hypothetical protein